MDTRFFYLGLIALVAVQRLVELSIAKRNTRIARRAGAIEFGRSHYPWMVALHAVLLLGSPLEVFLLDRSFVSWLAFGMLTLLAAAAGLRWWVIRALGERWTTRVLCWPGKPVVRRGPYRWMRHPNYAAVAVEFAALPLVHGAWLTAIAGSLLNAILLRVRIRIEEAALSKTSDYDRVFYDTDSRPS